MKKFVILLFFTFLGFEISHACICDFGLLENRIEKSHFIFTGKVISAEDIYADSTSNWPTQQRVVIVIEKKFKGNQNDTLTINSDLHSCASFFEENKRYLVFAGHSIESETEISQNFIDTNNKIVTGQCYGTKEIEYSNDEIRLLEKLFSSNSSIEDISPDKLYNEIWKDESFIFTDEYPEFPTGSDSLSSFIQNNLTSCSLPKERPNSSWHDEGKDDSLYNELNMDFESREPTFVWVHFDISKTGELNNFRVDRDFSLNKECNDEALRVAKLMPDWIPAKIKGIPVNSSHWIEMNFKPKSAY